LSLDILPKTSSKTTMFGLGKEQILLNTALKAKEAIVLSNFQSKMTTIL
jgi:hypothetical protein